MRLVGLHSEYHANVEPETLCGFWVLWQGVELPGRREATVLYTLRLICFLFSSSGGR